MAVVACRKNHRGYCIRERFYFKDWRDRSLKECPYNKTVEASIDCKDFRALDDEYSSSIVCIYNVEEMGDFLECRIGINTDLGNILIDSVMLTKYQDGFLGYIVKIDESRGISISKKLEKEIIAKVRKYLKEKK